MIFYHHNLVQNGKEIKDRANYNGLYEKTAPSSGGRGNPLKTLRSVAGYLADRRSIPDN